MSSISDEIETYDSSPHPSFSIGRSRISSKLDESLESKGELGSSNAFTLPNAKVRATISGQILNCCFELTQFSATPRGGHQKVSSHIFLLPVKPTF